MTWNFEELGVVIAILTSIVGFIVTYAQSRERFAKLEVKVDTLWDFLVKRGAVEAYHKDLITINSPVEVRASSYNYVSDSLQAEIQQWYAAQQCKLADDKSILLGIEKQFGARLFQEVCLPHRLTHGECLLIAAAIAKGTPQVDIV